MRIFEPTVEDVRLLSLQIVDLISSYARECGQLDVNPEYIFGMVLSAASEYNLYLSLLMDKGEVVGYFMGSFNEELFTGKPAAFQCGFFVKQSHRQYVHKLISAFEAEANKRDCRVIYLHVGPDAPYKRWKRVLGRSGFKPAETFFKKEL